MVWAASLLLAVAGLANGLASTDTITWGGDNSRAGYQTNHNMDPAVVGSSQFDQLFKTVLPGNYKGYEEVIFSQPLVYTPNGGDDQFVYFSTTQNNVYKLHAKTGEIVASRNLAIPFLTDDLDGCVDINPTVGVIGTGVIDPETETLYLVAKTYADQNGGDGPQGKVNGRNYVHALDVNDLTERENFPIDLEGLTGRNNPTRMFNGGIQLQRPGLLHQGQYIYAGFGSHCVQYNFTGWVIGWDKTSGEIVEHWVTQGDGVPNDIKGAGIWMSGGGLTSDDAGSMFFATGNGYASQLADIPVNGFSPPTALEEAAVHMSIQADGKLEVVDFFMPWEKQALDGGDKDLGTSPLEILPSEFSCGDISRIGVVTGKNKKTYWIDLDDMGGYRNGDGQNGLDNVIQVYENENSVYAGAGVYPLEGGYIYINVIQYPSNVFKFSCDNGKPSFTKVAETPDSNAYVLGVSHGTVTSLDGQPGTGLLWITDVQGEHLRIYDAVPKDGLLTKINHFSIPGTNKFTRPVFGDGVVYVGTNQGLVYGFGAPTQSPLNCTGATSFGNVDITEESETQTITCKALVGVTVTGVGLEDGADFTLSGLPDVPVQLATGESFTVGAKLTPSEVGLIVDNIMVNTTNNVEGYSLSTAVRLSGTGESANALLSVSPKTVDFEKVVVSDTPNGISQSVILSNEGNSPLTVQSIRYSTESADGPFQTWAGNGTLTVGKFTVRNLPRTIAAASGVTLNIGFDSSSAGDYSGYLSFVTDGGNGSFSIQASAGPAAVALLEFQTPDGQDWVPYEEGVPFTFGNVTENTALALRFRVTNTAPVGGVSLSLTVSKPPFGVDGIVRAANQVDLAEGTRLDPGESSSAVLTCAVPKSQWNVDPYNGTSVWTMNNNDPNFGKQVIEFFCGAIAEQAPPLIRPGEGQYRYIGCFLENNPGRQLDEQLYGDDNSTSAMCIDACAGDDWTFCGTQYHRECWAGSRIPSRKVDDKNCNFECSGDLNQICGGDGVGDLHGGSFISLFADSLQWDGNYTRPSEPSDPDPGNPDPGNPDEPGVDPIVNPGVNGYTSIGCYTEATTGRALPNGASMETPTVANCVDACAAKGYIYAGLEYSQECWCGNELGSGAVPAAASECGLACKGNSTELCGGFSHLNVYQLGAGTITTSTSVSSSTTMPPSNNTSISTSVSTSTPPVSLTTTTTSTITPPPVSLTTTSTSTTAPPATSTTPAVKETVGDWTFEGCYTETTNGRALYGDTYAFDNMTLEICADFCDGFTYFGVEYGRECYCGDSLREGSVLAANQKDCSFLCPGDKTTYCGAGMRLQLYQFGAGSNSTTTTTTTSVASSTTSSTSTTPTSVAQTPKDTTTVSTTSSTSASTPSSSSTSTSEISSTTTASSVISSSSTTSSSPAESSTTASTTTTTTKTTKTTSTSSASATPTGPIVFPGNVNFTYYGCVSEPSSGRLLKTQIFNDGDDMTIEACLERCWDYNYAGVEYGRECWCNDNLYLAGNTGAVPGKNVTDSECSFLCPGDDNVFCGAGSRMSLYISKDLVGSS